MSNILSVEPSHQTCFKLFNKMWRKCFSSPFCYGGEGLNKKLKYYCLENIFFTLRAEQTDGATQAYYRSGSGGKAAEGHGGLRTPSSDDEQFLWLFGQKYYFSDIWITFRKFLEPFERTKFLKFGSFLNE